MFKKIIFFLLSICTIASASPQAVVFDFGGVILYEPKPQVMVDFLCQRFALSSQEFDQIQREKRKATQSGKSDIEFWLQYAQEHKIYLPIQHIQDFFAAMKEAIGINPDMITLVEKLQAKHICVGLVSNIDKRFGKMLKDLGVFQPFSPCLLSYEIGMEKPDPKVFELLIQNIGAAAKDIVFIDDRIENITAAKKLGLDTILFKSQKELEKELATRGLMHN